jgi:hypothetical protein
MTSYAEPEKVACPYCDAIFLRLILRSYNTFNQILYSDGGTAFGIESVLQNEGRCASCESLITGIQELSAIEAPKTFIPTMITKHLTLGKNEEPDFLPFPVFEDFVELFYDNSELDKKRTCALKAVRAYHQVFCLQQHSDSNKRVKHQNAAPTSLQQSEYLNVCNFILSHRVEPKIDEYCLICADIYRLRGEFTLALKEFSEVQSEKFRKIVEQGKQWCLEENTWLMELDF